MRTDMITAQDAVGLGPLDLPIYAHQSIKQGIAETRSAVLLQTEAVSFAEDGAGHTQGVRRRTVGYGRKLLEAGNALVAGDNLSVMKRLYEQHGACIDLIYIDPPFLSNAQYEHRGMAEGTRFSDQWAEGHKTFVPWLTARIVLMHQLLKPTGSIYVHLDWHCVHYIKVEMDKIFGHNAFQREIIWRMGWVSGYKTKTLNWIRNHDNILFYTKSPKQFVFNKEYIPYDKDYVRRDGKKPTGRGIAIEDTWNCSESDRMDTIQIKSFDREKSGYSTQKNEALLARIIRASSPPGGVVADFFSGSGTTCVVAQKLGRRWIGVDCNPQAIEVAAERVSRIAEQRDKVLGEPVADFAAATREGFAKHTAGNYAEADIALLEDARDTDGLSAYQHFVLDAYLNATARKGDAILHAVRIERGEQVAVLVATNRGQVARDEVIAMLAGLGVQKDMPGRVEIIARGFEAGLVEDAAVLPMSAARVTLVRFVPHPAGPGLLFQALGEAAPSRLTI